jgi:hypothetical protein
MFKVDPMASTVAPSHANAKPQALRRRQASARPAIAKMVSTVPYVADGILRAAKAVA